MGMYQLSKRRPALIKGLVRKGLEKQLPAGYDIATHFTPPYDPWDQRFCVVPEGDLFRAIREDKAEIVTGRIDTFTATGIRLTDGRHLDADVIVTATGLNMQILGGAQLAVDGREVRASETVGYRGAMFSGVPNLAASMGYTNASWTLKCDLICAYVVRLLQEMSRRGVDTVIPTWTAEELPDAPFLDLTSGYVLRSLADFPKQGHEVPWRVHQNYVRDRKMFRDGQKSFDGLVFSRSAGASPTRSAGARSAADDAVAAHHA
jgi:monooxygenase